MNFFFEGGVLPVTGVTIVKRNLLVILVLLLLVTGTAQAAPVRSVEWERTCPAGNTLSIGVAGGSVLAYRCTGPVPLTSPFPGFCARAATVSASASGILVRCGA